MQMKTTRVSSMIQSWALAEGGKRYLLISEKYQTNFFYVTAEKKNVSLNLLIEYLITIHSMKISCCHPWIQIITILINNILKHTS